MMFLPLCFVAIMAAAVHCFKPFEDPNLFEGDMILDPDQLNEIRNGHFNKDIPLAATTKQIWPRKIPFDYHELKWHGNGRYAIDQAIKAFENNTCLRFVKRTTEKGYMKFYNGQSCSTQVGYSENERRIYLGKGCWEPNIAIHEMMHALGFHHEHTRPDRDNYVKIHFENIATSVHSQFNKRGSDEVNSLGVPYDYYSIMHYRKTSFSLNEKITIETLDKSKQDIIGEQKVLSKNDTIQINKLYRCDESDKTTKPPKSTPGPSSCTDLYDNCKSHYHKCSYPKDDIWYKWVAKQCKATCGLCPGKKNKRESQDVTYKKCEDSLVNCDTYKLECNSASMQDFMKRYCPATCGYCSAPATTVSPVCFDLTDCTVYVLRGYCKPTAPAHFHRMMKKKCIKSCGWCHTVTPLPPIGTPPPWPKECGVPSVFMSRVIGGKEAKPGSWPWQARLYKTNTYASYCGASLISATWLVTAAHCVKGRTASDITVHLGVHRLDKREPSLQQIRVRQVIVHYSYGAPSRMNNDVALLQLVKPAILNDRVKTVCLPKQDEKVKVGTNCYITGWGKTKHPGTGSITLQQSDLDIVDSTICHALNYANYRIRVTDSMVCAGLGTNKIQSGCHGDSGGPLVCKQNGRFVLHGDVSWGSHICDTSMGYTVFGRITHFRQWMDRYIYS